MNDFGNKLNRLINEHVSDVVDKANKVANNNSAISIGNNTYISNSDTSSGSCVSIQNDVRLETSQNEIRLTYRKPRKVYINGRLIEGL